MEGGPDYDVQLSGGSSIIDYKLSTDYINLGDDLRFCDWITKDFLLENRRKVPFEFSVDLSNIKRKGLFEIQPLYGKILGGRS